MTTPVLTEEGKRLAEALVEAEILWEAPHGFEPFIETIAVSELNAAAASLRLPLEGDASLREALKRLTNAAGAIGSAPSEGQQSELWHSVLAIRAALARPQPKAKGPVAAAVERFAHAILHGDNEHREWLLEAARSFVAGKSVPPARGKGASTTPPAEAKTPDAGRTSEGKAWIAETDAARQRVADQYGVALTSTGSAGEDDTGVREAFRVGRKVPRNVYLGDRPVFMAASDAEAAWLVRVLNAGQNVLRAWAPDGAPQPPKAETPAIPTGVYYNDGNFYDATTRQGLGNEFYATWRQRHSEFPNSPTVHPPAALSTAPAARPGDEVNELREALAAIKATGLRVRLSAPNPEQDWKNAVVRMEREAEQALAAAPAADGGRG